MSIKENLVQIKASLGPKAELIAVSKTKPIDMIKEAIECGQVHFGENKVQELADKAQELKNHSIKWHFIGKLQTNKINALLKVENLISIHSIDSIKLLDKLLLKKIDNIIELFIQVNTSGEDEKSGFLPETDFTEIIKKIDDHQSFNFKGFMSIGKIRTDDFEGEAHKNFALLQEIAKKYSLDRELELSMGMSNDYKIAINYDSNWIRVGSSIFGDR